jgi:hypothetical protein
MSGYCHRILLVEQGEFGERAVGGRSAERDQRTARRPAVDPTAKECARDTRTDSEAGHCGAHRDDLARAIGQWNGVGCDRPAHVVPARDQKVAVVERRRVNSHQNLRGLGLGIRTLTAAQAVERGASGNDFIGAHQDPSQLTTQIDDSFGPREL